MLAAVELVAFPAETHRNRRREANTKSNPSPLMQNYEITTPLSIVATDAMAVALRGPQVERDPDAFVSRASCAHSAKLTVAIEIRVGSVRSVR